MTMYLAYGDYEHVKPEVRIDCQLEQGGRGNPMRWRYKVTVSNWLSGAGISELSAKLIALENAHERPDASAGLRYYDDNDVTALEWSAAQTMGGIKIESFNYPDGIGAEWATKRKYEIVFAFDIKYQSAEEVVSFTESLSFSGGGPRTAYSQPIEGLPERYQIAENTIYKAVESGVVVGLTTWPDVPPARWPDALNTADDEEISKGEPREFNNGVPAMFPVSWSRTYYSPVALDADPRTAPPIAEED